VELYKSTGLRFKSGAGKGSQKTIWFCLCALCLYFLLISCGIEDYVYLEPVDSVSSTGGTSARIITPNNSGTQEFRYYAIFYRVYISDISVAGSITTSEQRYTINPALSSHYNTINPYTTNDNISPSSVGTVFSSLKYYPLYVNNGSVNVPMSQLLTTAASFTIELEFPVDPLGPYLKTGGGAELRLRRASDGFTPIPDRRFINSTELTDENSITENSNADIEKKTGMTLPYRYTYVSMYIAAAGTDKNFT
jgi:hypothetical protein